LPKILKIDQLIDRISKYVQIRLDLAKADLAGHLSGVISGIFSLILVLFFLAFFCLFLSFGIAILLNELFESSFWGYLIVSVFYLILFGVAVSLSRSGKLKESIRQSFLDDE